MKVLLSLAVVIALVLIAYVGAGMAGATYLFGVILPLLAIIAFVVGVVWRVVRWARSPVPFRIPTTCGQQRSLSWIKQQKLDNPFNGFQALARMVLEVLLFRSLFRNTKAEVRPGPKLVYGADKLLWLGALAFHWSFLIIFLRHYRFFAEPVPGFVLWLQSIDGLFQVGLPTLLITNIVLVLALLFLLGRRLFNSLVRYISLPGDHFPLLLLLGIAVSGIYMRYFDKVDVIKIKQLALGLVGFHPVVPDGIGVSFYIHLFLVSALLVYFPASKLMHMAGVFLSPTRNLANNNRAQRHLNPWNYPVKVHTYAEYEDEFRGVMKAAGMPVEKE